MAEKKMNSLNMFLAKKAKKDEKESGYFEYSVDGSDEKLTVNRLSGEKVMEIVEHADPEQPMKEVYASMIYTMGEIVEIGKELKKVIDDVDIERIKNS